ncbi:MAG: hypothetical protein WCA46_23970 [Actinocatenispora sp.]
MSRLTSTLLVLFGVWSWLIWPRFALAIWQDDRSWRHGAATSFLWVHAAIVVASLVFGTALAVLGIRGWLAIRATRRGSAG